MNVQAQMSGQVPNQLSQQNGETLPSPAQIQNLTGSGVNMMVSGSGARVGSGSLTMDPDILRDRVFMREKIYAVIMQRYSHSVDEHQKQKFKDFSERLEGGLFKAASNKEEYLNLSTLETRISSFLKRPNVSNHNQRHPQMINSSSAVGTMIPTPGTMIPTPGLSHVGISSSVPSNVDAAMISSGGVDPNMNSVSLLSNTSMHA